MKPKVSLAALKKTRAREYVVRFLFGGLVTAATGLLSHAWGPAVGGLFLGFPAVLPASLTLVQEHDGRTKAVDEARGARLGSVALAAFALLVFAEIRAVPVAIALVMAAAGWLAIGSGLWWIVHRHDRRP
jgi:uncharacterized protein DUF3147